MKYADKLFFLSLNRTFDTIGELVLTDQPTLVALLSAVIPRRQNNGNQHIHLPSFLPHDPRDAQRDRSSDQS